MDASTARTLNIREIVRDAGGPTSFANTYGGGRWSQEQVSQWISDAKPKSIGGRLARDLEHELKLSTGALDYPLMEVEDERQAPPAQPKPQKRSGAPVVGRVQAGADGYWTDSQHPAGGGDGFIEVPTKDPNAYALQVVGNSMAPAIRPGWYIVVEPNGEPQPGEFVVVKLNDGRKMVKEFLFHRAGQWSFESINQDHNRIVVTDAEIEAVHPVAYTVPPSRVRI